MFYDTHLDPSLWSFTKIKIVVCSHDYPLKSDKYHYTPKAALYLVSLLMIFKKLNTSLTRKYIRITFQCYLYSIAHHIYIVKLGFTGVYIIFFFFFLLQNVHCGYSLLNEAVLTCTQYVCIGENKKENRFFLFRLKIILIFAYRTGMFAYYMITKRRYSTRIDATQANGATLLV